MMFKDKLLSGLCRCRSIFNKIKRRGRSAAIVCFSAVSVIAITLSLVFTGARFAYKVKYSGKIIATVENKQKFDKALEKVVKIVNGSNVEKAVEEPEYVTVLVPDGSVDTTEQVVNAIIENTDNIVNASIIAVDGEKLVCADSEQLHAAVDARLNEYNIEGVTCTSEFVENVNISDGYYLAENLDDISKVHEVLAGLSVKTSAVVMTNISTPYKKVITKTNEKTIGYNQVVVSGQNGTDRVIENVTLINGQETSRESISREILSQPVNEVTLVGTAKSVASASQKAAGHSAGFLFPLRSGSWKISSYYGDNRGHKGVDLAASYGESIFAVASGRVTYASTRGAYGYCVMIDHGNGITTLYAHASKLLVTKGEYVNAGDLIALVGSTGNSYGNHLHFEVLVGGSNVDPAPYIGLD